MKFSGQDTSRWPPYRPFRAFGRQWRPDGIIIPKGEPSPKDFDDAVLAAHGLSELPKGEAGIRFVAWNHCPAVLVNDVAFAVLSPAGPWVSVDRDDVYHTGAEQSEGAWSKWFTDKFGPLDLSRWRPAAQAAANLEHAANLAHQIATAPLFLLREIDAP